MRLLIILHRYVGVAAGLLMVLWCLSGFVMMYQGYPKLEQPDRLAGLKPLRLTAEQAHAPLALGDDAQVSGFRLEMMGERPVLHVQQGRKQQAFDLATGRPLEPIPADQALAVAKLYATAHGIAGNPMDVGVVDVDQWTLDGIGRAGPMYHIRYSDPAGAELYVAQRTGQAVQLTTTRTRFLAWIGAIPHWLYPTLLRKNPAAWDAVVVWTSIAGVFLTAIGLYVGIARFKRYKSGRWSPYRGWFYWHHIIGLVFGVLTLTWVFSGLLTMGPWGFLESPAGRTERGKLAGTVSGADVKHFLAVAPALAQGNVAAIEAAPLGGVMHALVRTPAGPPRRVDASGTDHPLEPVELRAAMVGMGGPPVARFARIDREETYYYSGYDGDAVLPAYRADIADRASTTFYIDALSGRMVSAVDDTGRKSRWLRVGLHDIDFFPGLRARPVWDIVVLLLLAGVTAVCITGGWMAVLRVKQDLAKLKPRG